MTEREHILTLACSDRVGIVAALAKLMEANNCFIASSRTFGDPGTGRFFARVVFRSGDLEGGDLPEAFCAELQELGASLSANYEVHASNDRLKTLILTSKSDHCANTLLYSARRGELPIDIVGLVSNHEDLRGLFAHWPVQYTHIPVTADKRSEAEAKLFDLIEDTGAELIVLARYMQVLSASACKRLEGRCINIHHSFLPGFKGARPYHQAHARGVKMIGATAHYVTANLDEGPIITQVTEAIDHSHSPADMIEIGRHLEGTALLRAVKAHSEHRIFSNQGKTVVFAR